MGRKNECRSHAVWSKLTDEEFDLIETGWKKSTIVHLSEYLRRVLFEKPITFYMRNQSLDELMDELILLRRDFNTIRTNIDETVLRLHTQQHLPEIRRWIEEFERSQARLLSNVEDIKTKIHSIGTQWLQ